MWMRVKSLQWVLLYATPWTVACRAPLAMGFSRQEYWSVLPFSSPGHLPNPGMEPGSPTLQADSLLSEPPGKPWFLLLKRAGEMNVETIGRLGHLSHLWNQAADFLPLLAFDTDARFFHLEGGLRVFWGSVCKVPTPLPSPSSAPLFLLWIFPRVRISVPLFFFVLCP